MTPCTRPLTALVLAAGLAVGSIAIAQENPMPKQQKVPPMTGPQGGPTDEKSPGMTGGAGSTLGMGRGMEADAVINKQLAKFATSPVESHDAKFALMAGVGNMAEIEMSRMVAAQATDPKVKAVAEMMVKEHTMAQEKLMPIGQKLGVTYPTSLPMMKQQEAAYIAALPVDKMEKAYLSHMRADHLMTINNYTDHLPMIQDSDLKAYATEVLPKVRAHTADIFKAAEARGMPLDLKMDSTTAGHNH
ncbi:MAG TPA: DUF4142 domain-containing protein [Tepidisphaeraceae bacterium]|jgi:putative membrane protein